MGSQLITILGALLGVIIGWGLNQYAQWKKDRKEDNRIRKEVLFYLLEFRYMLAGININPVIDLLCQKAYEKVPEIPRTEETDRQLKQYILPFALQATRHTDNRLPAIKDGFTKAVNKLSSVDPILAYRLSGQEESLNLSSHVVEYFRSISQTKSEISDAVIKYVTDTLNSQLIQEAEINFDDLIESVAKRINDESLLESKKTLVVIRERLKMENPELDKMMDNFISNTRPFIEGTSQ